MNEETHSLVFGPVPSRRLGKSVGINNIAPKYCSYSCIYCQLGRTHQMQINRTSFYDPDEIIRQTKQKITQVNEKKEHIDYLTIVPDGEPTLDKNLGVLIKKLKEFPYPIAVITNATLLDQAPVRKELSQADWVSVKIDAISEKIWKYINRGHKDLDHKAILNGIKQFSRQYSGNLCTETMLIKDGNDSTHELQKIADFISTLHPKTSYLSIPIRPPAEHMVRPATEKTIAEAYHLFTDQQIDTEYLIGYEGNEFAFTGNAEKDLLSITSVHPMREEAVQKFLEKADEHWNLIDRLLKEQKLVKHTLNHTTFYMRKLPSGERKK